MKFDDTSPIVVAGGDGRVLAENRPARRMLGPGTGKYCWDFVGQLKDDEEKIPCRDGCVMELLEEGMDCSQQTQFTINGKHNHLSCVPANGIVICMLRSDEGKTPAMMHSLTPREREILRLLAKGETTATAACQLGWMPPAAGSDRGKIGVTKGQQGFSKGSARGKTGVSKGSAKG